MLDKTIEKKLINHVKKMGGIAPKFVSPGFNGVPDRIVLLPGGHMAFIEFKAPGKLMRPMQLMRTHQFEKLGFKVFCIDCPDDIDDVLRRIKNDKK